MHRAERLVATAAAAVLTAGLVTVATGSAGGPSGERLVTAAVVPTPLAVDDVLPRRAFPLPVPPPTEVPAAPAAAPPGPAAPPAAQPAAPRARPARPPAPPAPARTAAAAPAGTVAPAARPPAPQPVASSVAAPSVEVDTGSSASYEARVLQLVNGHRADAGLPPVRPVACAASYARGWAVEMARRNTLAHSDVGQALDRCGGDRVGENVGRGDVGPDRMVELWMASGGHRQNVLDPAWTHVGTGAALRTANGVWFASQVFLRL